MSKERLEKAKKILNHIKGYGVYDGNDDIEIFEWLIEQAERVEELEKFKRSAEQLYKNYHLSAKRSVAEKEELREQNKRYTEAIEFGIEYLKNSDIRQVQLVVTALKGALEGEE